MTSARVRLAAGVGQPLVLIVVVAVAVLMILVVADRTMVVAFTVVIFVKAEGAVAIEIFEIAVERESRAEESQLVCRAAAERGGGEQRTELRDQVVELAAEVGGDTAATRAAREKSEREMAADAAIASDPFVVRAIAEFDARIIPDSTRPLD